MKKLLILLVLAGIIGGGAYYYVRHVRAAKDAEIAQQPETKTIKVERGDIDLRVSTTGKIVSNLDVDIKSKASGQIVKLPFDISDNVTSGELLMQLDPVDENRNVSQRMANLASAKARLAQAVQSHNVAIVDLETQTSSTLAEQAEAKIRNHEAQAKLARGKELFEKRLVSKEQLDAAETEAASAQNQVLQAETRVNDIRRLPLTVAMRKHDIELQQSAVKTAEVELENAEQRLKETKIYAPMNGVLTDRPVQTGQIIASGISNVGGGTTLMTLSDLSRLFVEASVDESDIGKVKLGQSASITADAYPGKRFTGKVVRVAPKGETDNNVVTFKVKIEIDAKDRELLKPEMTANVDIQADRREKVLVVPNEVVLFGKEGYYVELPPATPDGKPKRQIIKSGLTDGINTEILEGLTENQEVALPKSVQSRWAREGGPQAGMNLTRGMQMATWRLSGAGGRGRR